VGVGGVLIHQGRVLLIRRGKEPLRGRWVVPGGTVELGETLEQALQREMLEETNVCVSVGELLTLFDHVERTPQGVRYHYVIADYLCAWRSGEAQAGSDAEAVAWARHDQLQDYDLPSRALDVIEDAFRRVAVRG